MSIKDEPTRIRMDELSLALLLPDDKTVATYANQLWVASGANEVNLLFGQMPPVRDSEEHQRLMETKTLSVPVVANIVIARSFLPALIRTLQEHQELLQQQDERADDQ